MSLKALVIVTKRSTEACGSTVFWYDIDFLEFDSADFKDSILQMTMSYQKKGFPFILFFVVFFFCMTWT